LRIVGDGPVAGEVRLAARMMPSVEWLGPRRPDEVQALMAAARLLVVPSLCYEGFPKVVAEALAVGTPALVSNLGSLAELIDDGRTGVHFGAADPAALAAAVDRLWGDEAALSRMRRQARQEFESKYTASRNYELLTNVYAAALQRRHGAEMSLSAM
jgi:glycosyltransferase involved in cell wall biosynthesis